MHIYEVLKRPVMTEKSGRIGGQSQYVFEVDRRANRVQVKQAVERAFNVTVVNVNVMNVPPKMGHFGRRAVVKQPAWKKAVVTLAPGNRIEFFEGV